MESNLTKKQCLLLADQILRDQGKRSSPEAQMTAAIYHVAAQVAELNERIETLSKKIPDKGGLFGMFAQ